MNRALNLLKSLTLPSAIKAMIAVIGIRMGLWILPYRSLDRILPCILVDDGHTKEIDWLKAKNTAYWVQTCAAYIIGATCLTQALATRTLLALKGQPSELKFGVRFNDNNKFEAHSWLEINGRVIIGGKTNDVNKFSVLNCQSQESA